MQNDAPQTIYLKDYTPPPFLIDRVDLKFDVYDDHTEVHSRMVLNRNDAHPHADAPLVLDGEELTLVQLKLDGEVLDASRYLIEGNTLTLAALPSSCILEVVTHIQPRLNTALSGLYESNHNLFTQCEAEGFRRITYFLDRPDVMARYTTTITADKQRFPVLLSNGNLVGHGNVDKQRHWVKWVDPFRKPSYLFALVAGKLVKLEDHFKTQSGKDVKLEIYVEPGNVDKCHHAMVSVKKSMKWDEEVYGLEYDLDSYMIVAVGDFNMGAMENKGLNIFNTKYVLAKPDTATDIDYAGIEAVIAHEYFHNWTGNRVTCRDWFQLSLKEGLTVFRDQMFSGDMGSHAVERIDQVRTLRTLQFPEDAGPMAHPVRPASYIEINNFYTVTVYEKGSEVVRMYHTLLGAAGFRKGMDLYFRRHDGQAVTTDDFLAAMADANETDLTQFKYWYSQAGTPIVKAIGTYDEQAHTYTLTLKQSCPATPDMQEKQPFLIPVAMGLLSPQGHELPLQLEGETQAAGTSRVLRFTESEQRFVFVNVPAKPVPSLFRGFSAPVKLDYEWHDDELTFLMAHDGDDFNRWEASQTLTLRLILRLVADHQAGRELAVPTSVIEAFRVTLLSETLDKSLIALALTLPAESYIGDQMAVVDPDAIHMVRDFVRTQLALALRDDWLKVFRANDVKGEYRFEQKAISQRALKNLCLTYLLQLDEHEMRELCVAQANSANNMTDTMGALSVLTHIACPQREPTLSAFYERWQGEALVVDKWLTLQASSTLPDTLSRVQQLLSHPAFTLKNPNKVRSLLGAFASNQVCFHDKSGAGYRFFADQVLALDKLNPQIAARMSGAFNRWKRFDGARQALMKAELTRMVETDGLSKDVYEIVSKALA
ncbi:aminopeptidase N [Chitinivorax tropicus]|uniref:Aminopeptidase N n=1 Tax=Chitinivorax tropicus TaxID=714531 RepID=A0A840MSP3_9PROT|nr:aminopeptidase N [Chitinivorax tropicus]MBB5019426.1 aminopeptidase N [Chitinivorax tropicus]